MISRKLLLITTVTLSLAAILLIRFSGHREDKETDAKMRQLGRAAGPVIPPSEMPEEPHPAVSSPEMDAVRQRIHRGIVQSTINASRYTYIEMQTDQDGVLWAAVPQVMLSKGEEVAVVESLVMKDFVSKTLGRTFPSVVFGVLIQQDTASTGDAGASGDAGVRGADLAVPSRK